MSASPLHVAPSHLSFLGSLVFKYTLCSGISQSLLFWGKLGSEVLRWGCHDQGSPITILHNDLRIIWSPAILGSPFDHLTLAYSFRQMVSVIKVIMIGTVALYTCTPSSLAHMDKITLSLDIRSHQQQHAWCDSCICSACVSVWLIRYEPIWAIISVKYGLKPRRYSSPMRMCCPNTSVRSVMIEKSGSHKG